ncbi:MAG: fluoride efflux transporter CrcB, partial [Marinilabiliaceae bacterium]
HWSHWRISGSIDIGLRHSTHCPIFITFALSYNKIRMIKAMLIAGFGGFIGTILRFLIVRYVQITVASTFPWGTLLVNVAGSFLIGVFFGISEKGQLMSADWRLFLTVGLCGGFTTFSSFSHEGLLLLENNEMFRFAAYAGLSFFFGLLAVFVGRALIKMI